MSHPDLLNLWCWVLGGGPQNVFPVKIPSDEDVATLKKYIKNKKQHMFDHIPAHYLVLHKITITDAALDDKLEKINLENLENLDKLWPTLKLSQAFSHPLAEDELYVVIVRPPGSECNNVFVLHCNPSCVFTLDRAASQLLPGTRDRLVPTLANRAEFTMKIRGSGRWDHLCEDDLYISNVQRARSPQFLEGFRERLGRKRYIDNNTGEVCAILGCCRLPDFRSPRFMRIPSNFSNPVRRSMYSLCAHISTLTPSTPRNPTFRNWTE